MVGNSFLIKLYTLTAHVSNPFCITCNIGYKCLYKKLIDNPGIFSRNLYPENLFQEILIPLLFLNNTQKWRECKLGKKMALIFSPNLFTNLEKLNMKIDSNP